jgi:hypothetical protein
MLLPSQSPVTDWCVFFYKCNQALACSFHADSVASYPWHIALGPCHIVHVLVPSQVAGRRECLAAMAIRSPSLQRL